MGYRIQYDSGSLRTARRIAKWTQKDLAQRSGFHVQAVSYWEGKNKHGKISGVAVAHFAAAFENAGIDMNEVNPEQKQPQLCGARNRQGLPCAMKPVHSGKRCKFHGGMSTGPKTQEGRERIAQAQKRRWAEYRNRLIETNVIEVVAD